MAETNQVGGQHGKHAKSVKVVGSYFNCLPGHVTIEGTGFGATLRVAAQRAIANMLADARLRGKHVSTFRVGVVVLGVDEVAA